MRTPYTYIAFFLLTFSGSCSNNQSRKGSLNKIDSLDYTPVKISNTRYLEYDSTFAIFWKQISTSIRTNGQDGIKSVLLDSLNICDTIMNTSTFLTRFYSKIFDNYVTTAMADSSRIEYYSYLPTDLMEISFFARNRIIKDQETIKYREVEILPLFNAKEPIRIVFSFIKTSKGYILYRYYSLTNQHKRQCFS